MDLIKQAYQKLRSALYFEKGNLQLRDDFVDFAEKHGNAAKYMQGWFEDEKKQNDSLNEINVHFLPKKFEDEKNENGEKNGNYISNNRVKAYNKVERVFIYADIPIELHIVAVMWTIKYGAEFEKKLNDCCKANRLIIDEKTEKVLADGKQLYKPYFKQYQNWWSKAIDEANHIIENGNNVYILNLDIKNYYHSVDIDFNNKLFNQEDNLTKLLIETHKRYNAKFDELCDTQSNINRLPISLYSSSVLANWYLRDLDEQIENQLMPAYYGRYVDDILMVFRSVSECYESTIQFIDEKLNGILKPIKSNENQEYTFASYPNLKIQSSKTTLYYFDKEYSTSLLSKFEAEQRKKSSEFRFMSDEEDSRFSDEELSCFDACFDNSDESSAKFKPQIEDKYKLSCFLSKFINRKLLKGAEYGKVDTDKIKKFFKGNNLVKYFQYWEKLFTLYAVSNDENSFKQLHKEIEDEIKKIQLKEGNVWPSITSEEKIIKSLNSHLQYSITMALPLFSEEEKREKLSTEISFKYQAYINQHFVRHQYLKEREYNDDLPFDLFFYEKAFLQFKGLIESLKAGSNTNVSNEYIKILREKSVETKKILQIIEDENLENNNDERKTIVNKINIIAENEEINIKIALVNKFVNENSVTESRRKGGRILLHQEFEKYLQILDNVATINKCDLFVMPEVSLPVELLPVYLQWAARKQIGFVAGLEYTNTNKVVCNFDVACLPIELDHRKDCVPIFRLKNHYAPKEIEIINKEEFTIPRQVPKLYNLINWRGFYFSVYNCFELSSITDRSRVIGEVDAIFAIAYNPDTNYYNSIVEATARDMHCFVILCNTSQYGDSQIVAPKETEKKFILKVKGGTDDKNPINILVGHLDVKALREYQLYADEKHKFKPLPADYPKDNERLKKKESNAQKDKSINQ
ncbi:MAG: RNA-directed DNA polymerase [Salinivirgaceae bacterium]|nr:RNA-directed DNA polymerase [Salinivirgaceae bacterium]